LNRLFLKNATGFELFSLIDNTISGLDLPNRPESLFEPVKYTLNSGGKRVRPYLTLLGCGITGGNISDALYAATAIELVHNFTLIHDDIMDKAALRRGKPTVYKKWDESTAILAGDYLFAKSFDLINYYGGQKWISKEQYSQLHNYFLEGVKVICTGQAQDIDLEKTDCTELNEYLDMIACKTSALLSSALKVGGVIANADKHSIKYLDSIGLEMGYAFQIQDDLLDITGKQELFGKQIGNDLKKQKKTYLSVLAFKRANKFKKQKLLRIFNSNEELQYTDVNEVLEIYDSLNVIEDAKKAIKFHYESAVELIDVFDNSVYKSKFFILLNNLIKRQS